MHANNTLAVLPGVIGAIIGAITVGRRLNRLLRRFREMGAVTPENAVTLPVLGEARNWIFDSMSRRGVIVMVTGDRYYLDERAAAADQRRREKRAVLLFVGIFIILLPLLVFSVFRSDIR